MFPRFRISLAALLLLVAVLGPGVGFGMRWRNEWERTRTHRVVSTLLSGLQQSSLDEQEAILKQLDFAVDNGPEFTALEREHWNGRIEHEMKRVRGEMQQENSEWRSSCYRQR